MMLPFTNDYDDLYTRVDADIKQSKPRAILSGLHQCWAFKAADED